MLGGVATRQYFFGRMAAYAIAVTVSVLAVSGAGAYEKKPVETVNPLVQPVQNFTIQFGGRDRFEERFRERETEWILLGRTRVGFLTDRDVIRVGRGEGRFDALVFTVRRNDIELLNVSVVYGNGQIEDLGVRERIREGERSRIINLTNRPQGRFIEEIRFIYRSRPDFRGQAEIAVYGREVSGRGQQLTEGKRASCETYASIAVVQSEANDRYNCRYRGPEWSINRRGHYEWCLLQRREFMLDEIRWRQNELQKCFNNLGDFDDERYDRSYRRRFRD